MKLKNRLLYAGTSKVLFERLRPHITEINRQSLCLYSLLGCFLMICMLIASTFEASLVKMRPLYIMLNLVCFVVYFLSRFVRNKTVTALLTDGFVAMILLFGILMGTVVDPTSLSLTYTVLLFTVPLLFCASPLNMILTSIASMVVYFIFAHYTQSSQMIAYNATNIIPFGLLSLLLCPYIINLKMDHAMLLSSHKSISSILPTLEESAGIQIETMVSFVQIMMNYHTDESLLHCKRVMQYSRLLCRVYNTRTPEKQLSDNDIMLISIGAELHDIGKIYIPDNILKKQDPFTAEEWEIIKNHTVVGAHLVEYVARICNVESQIMRNIIMYHHERWDGSGYPEHLAGEDIPIEAQLVAIAEVYDSLTADNYSDLRSHEEASRMILDGECGVFNPRALETFRLALDDFNIINENKKQERWDLLDKVYAKHSKLYWRVKRAFDIVASAGALLFFSPILLGVALAIKIDDPKSPVIFKQERLGRHKKPFKMYKFRTMVPNAEQLLKQLQAENEKDGPVFKIKKDPRITRPGHFLRKTSLDELPQLLNIIKGDMTIVGPRPPLASEVEKYSRYHEIRLSVTPGLTCFWQAHESRDDVSFEDWMDMDVAYIGTRSIGTDIGIILKTVMAVVKGSGN